VGTDGGAPQGDQPTKLPAAPADCPMIATGTVTILGSQTQLWVGKKQEDKQGPIVIYWHATGSSSSEVTGFGLSAAVRQEIMDQGGIIAAPNGTTMKGIDTGNAVWFTGDLEIADVVVACAIKQLNIDTRRIYTAGGSAGALQAGAMVYWRAGYLASAIPNSGGVTPRQGVAAWQDPTAPIPDVLTMHGKMGTDVVVIDFATASMSLDTGVAAKGGFAVDCDHGGGHVQAPAALQASAWEFLKAHPYNVKPEPYAAGLPSTFPTYCKIITK
jgi:poly(3-hydroxybutyrate) depolymerase